MKLRTTDRRLRAVTYNIHKCRGMDRRVRPARIVDVLGEIDADVIALQEVVSIEGDKREANQVRFIAEELGYHCAFGQTRPLKGGRYGNVILSRFPICVQQNYDISSLGREPRGCLRTDIEIDGTTLHVFNVHLGTSFYEHRAQARRLFNGRIVNNGELTGPRIVLGDFNEWLRGGVSRVMKSHLRWADTHQHLGRSRTYPGVLPLFLLDHIYFDNVFTLERLHLHKRRKALIASDHLPLVADLRL